MYRSPLVSLRISSDLVDILPLLLLISTAIVGSYTIEVTLIVSLSLISSDLVVIYVVLLLISTAIVGSDSIEVTLIVVLSLISYNYTSYIVESLRRSMFSTYITYI